MAKKKQEEVSKVGGPTKIMKCSCAHDYQDSIYGKGLRMHNRTMKSHKTIYRCTVCSTEH